MMTAKITPLEAWLALSQVPKMGSRRLRKLLRLWQSPMALLQGSEADLLSNGLSAEQIARIKKPNWQWIKEQQQWQEQAVSRQILTYNDPAYPSLLQETVDPPLVLFAQGEVGLLGAPQLAMVGSRQPSPQGLELAEYFAAQLVKSGLVVTSGLALGIDGASHVGALRGHGQTIAVLGSGLEHIYPRRHQHLAQEIVASGGLLISEFSPHVSPLPAYFPRRNRIISGLCLGVLVVEATLRSGSLITARLAAEYGREVFALPGAISHSLSQGCHALIQQGAKLVTQLSDILTELAPLAIYCLETAERKTNNQQSLLDQRQQKLLQCVDFAVTSVDQIVRRSGLAASQVLALLSTLELSGSIKAVPGGYTRLHLKV